MTPQEKANHILNFCKGDFEIALAVVEEIIEAIDAFGYTQTMWDDFETGQVRANGDPTEYWCIVRNEISLHYQHETVKDQTTQP